MALYDVNGNSLSNAYDISGEELIYAYNIDGESIYRKGDIDYSTFTTTPFMTVPSTSFYNTSMQGMAIFNNVLFQCVADNHISLIDIPTGSLIAMMQITSGHGDALSFSDEYYDPNDEFPLLYITSDSNPANVYVNRVTRGTATLVRTLHFPDVNVTGYYVSHALDCQNKVLYMVGYTKFNYQQDDGTNNMIVSKWDLSEIGITDSGTIEPTLLDSFTIPFIYVAQDQKYKDGYIFVTSGYPDTVQKLYLIDPIAKQVAYTLILEGTAETEGIAFINDNMIIGQRSFVYTKYVFGVM